MGYRRSARSFDNDYQELNYLNGLLSPRRREGATSPDTERAVRRFEDLLSSRGSDDGSISLQEHLTLLHEIKGGFATAALHCRREIDLLVRSLDLGGPVGPITVPYVAGRMVHLGRLYVASSDKEAAVAAFREAVRFSDNSEIRLVVEKEIEKLGVSP